VPHKEGSTRYVDVPSIARWVRINGAGGRDPCDTTRAERGEWSPLHDIRGEAIQMMVLLPGKGSVPGAALVRYLISAPRAISRRPPCASRST